MKNIKYLFLAICAVALFSACSDEDKVNIDSLQVFGEEFYYGETVNVAMSVSMSNPDVADFYWECDGGTFLQRQGYKLNQWKAPAQSGTYTIKCTVKCGNAKQTREAHILVSGFFFERFSAGNTNAAPTGWSNTNSTVQIRNNRLEVSVTTAAQSSGDVRYNLGKSDLYPPFSFKSDVGIVGTTINSQNTFNPKYPNDSTVYNTGDGYSGKDNNCAYSITTNTPSATLAPTYFISEMRLEWWPAETHCLSRVSYIPVGETDPKTFFAGIDYDAFLRFQWTRRANAGAGISQSTGWYAIPIKTNAFKYYKPEGEVGRNIGMAVTEDYIVQVFVDDVKIWETDQVKTWRATAGNAPIAVKEYKYIYPSRTRVYLDNVLYFLTSDFK